MQVYQPINIQPKRILVITLRYLGDTLLVTPLLSSLRNAYPRAEIDVLLPFANLGVLEGNTDVSHLIPFYSKQGFLSFAKLLCGLFQKYDLAISTQGGDRPIICAIVAGKWRMGFVSGCRVKQFWKRVLLDRALEFADQHSHAVLENLRFCEALNITPCYKLTPPKLLHPLFLKSISGKYAVLHIMPQWQYKQWHQLGWIKLAYYLQRQGYQLVLTGSPQVEELHVVQELLSYLPPSACNLAGKLSLAELTEIINHASIFIGPDTGITHLAAATGVRTVAIFGPTDPLKWAPWPQGYAQNAAPFNSQGIQKINNVCLIQGESESGCVPCQLEGCERHRHSFSACLDALSAQTVIKVIEEWQERK
ncbi:glycosyltransferase family 9 protein [Methylomonas sp. AM2-LC]|uniref:glycosyltransferase family 9 protein n=1 Tax=Methylomonas sp. AM2-LC TaxID=3153301 RepID=UPI003267E8D0